MQTEPIPLFLVLIGFSLIPFALLALTSFVKMSVAFSILRNALGGSQIPSAAVTSLLALVLSLQVMTPVGKASYERVREPLATLLSSPRVGEAPMERTVGWIKILNDGVLPFEDFLRRHSRLRERYFFATPNAQSSTVKDLQPNSSIPNETLFSLIPAFLVSELSQGFMLGVMLFLPFLVIDLVVANLLIGLGLTMVSPVTIAFPVKLLLFAVCDGWFLLSRSLVLGYGGFG